MQPLSFTLCDPERQLVDSDLVGVQLVVPSPGPASIPPIEAGPGVSVPSAPAPTAGPPLPRTGTDLLVVLLIAVVLAALGAMLVQAGRARCRRA